MDSLPAPLGALTGEIVHGRGRGREVGMPTANLWPDPGQRLPECGVYATLTHLDGRYIPGVTNVGRRPSVDRETDLTVETYLPGFQSDLYGRRLKVEFYLYLRPVIRFDSLMAVRRQVECDALRSLDFFDRFTLPGRSDEVVNQ